MSRRDGAIVAWHEVPGAAPPRKGRPVGYGVPVSRKFRNGSITRRNTSLSCAQSYRTLRDGSLEGRCSRPFVPGFDRVVPTGQYVLFSVPAADTTLKISRQKRSSPNNLRGFRRWKRCRDSSGRLALTFLNAWSKVEPVDSRPCLIGSEIFGPCSRIHD
jgi:hypothetical protein